MSQLAMSQIRENRSTATEWGVLCRIGGAVLLLQLGLMLISVVLALAIGPEPATAAETFAALQNDGLAGLLRLDFATLLMIALFPFVGVAIFAALRKERPAYAMLALVLVLTGTLLALANHSAFALIRLSDLHAAATTAAAKEEWLLAGEAVIAGNMWNSSAGFLAGLFMQGGFMFISLVMLKSEIFGKGTAYTGFLANGLDFVHVLVGLVWPAAAITLLYAGGLFYLFWFPLLGRDLLRASGRP